MRIDGTQNSPLSSVEQKQQAKLKQACQDFEAIFLSQILKSMRKTVVKTDLFGKSSADDTFQEMMDSELCSAASKTTSVGIADTMYRQLSAQMEQENRSDNAETRGKADDSAKRSS